MDQNTKTEGGKVCDCRCSNDCGCPHHKMIPILVILFAVTFLFGEQGIFTPTTVNTVWPILLGLGGVQALMEDNCKCC